MCCFTTVISYDIHKRRRLRRFRFRPARAKGSLGWNDEGKSWAPFRQQTPFKGSGCRRVLLGIPSPQRKLGSRTNPGVGMEVLQRLWKARNYGAWCLIGADRRVRSVGSWDVVRGA